MGWRLNANISADMLVSTALVNWFHFHHRWFRANLRSSTQRSVFISNCSEPEISVLRYLDVVSLQLS